MGGERLKQRELEARRTEIESEVASKAKESVEKEVHTAKQDFQETMSNCMNTQAALCNHRETSARRARAFEAEVRRAKECARHAMTLRDRCTRQDLVGDDKAAFENAESCATKCAESASKALAKTLKRTEDSLKADRDAEKDLTVADEEAVASLQRREVVLKQFEARLTEVVSKFKTTNER